MKVVVINSDYSDIKNIQDVPEEFYEQKNALYIAAREGQLQRVDQQVVKKDEGNVVALWQLGDLGYINADGTINKSAFLKHPEVYAASPSRVPMHLRKVYEKLLWTLKNL